jgi:hypothetical protein
LTVFGQDVGDAARTLRLNIGFTAVAVACLRLTIGLNLHDWRERSRSFSSIAGVQMRSVTIADRGEPERYSGAAVSWELFSTLAVRPALGRDFVPDDDRPGAEPVLLLSDEVWRIRYAAD